MELEYSSLSLGGLPDRAAYNGYNQSCARLKPHEMSDSIAVVKDDWLDGILELLLANFFVGKSWSQGRKVLVRQVLGSKLIGFWAL